MGKKDKSLAKSELEVARIVWELGEPTVRQVHEALPDGRDLDFWTVQTYLRRLKEKGYLKTKRVGQGNVYSAAIKPNTVIQNLTDDFLERLFDGQVLPLFQQLIETKGLTDSEIGDLQSQLEELKRKQK